MGILDFLACPFLVIGNASLWLASLINGRLYVLMEITEDDGDSSQNGE